MSADGIVTEVRRVAELDAGQMDQVRDLLRAVWPNVDLPDFERRHPDRLVAAWRDGRAVSCLAIVEREIEVGSELLRVGGIGGVATLPEQQGRGLATRVLRHAARHLARETPATFGFLLCADEVVPFYARLGWDRIAAPITYVDTPGTPGAPGVREGMVLRLGEDAWPSGDVDLCGTAW